MNDVIKQRWERGKAATISFYNKKLRWKFKQFNREFPLFKYFGPMIGDKKEVHIADLGSGIISTTGFTWPTAKVYLYPSDILADEFNKIVKHRDKRWGKHLEGGYKPLVPIKKQDIENLTYEDNKFDIVHCVNTLDHCADPYKAIKEMYRVCKVGGWIYLRHFPNNAELQNYRGLHQWNIIYTARRRNDCLFKSSFNKFYLSECISGFKTVVRKELNHEFDDMIISKLKKGGKSG